MPSGWPLGRRSWIVLGVGVAVLATWAAFWNLRASVPPARVLAEALAARARGDHARALRLAQQVLDRDPHSQTALSLAGRSAVELQEIDLALTCFGRMQPGQSDAWLEAALLAGDLELDRGRASEAEHWYRTALEQNPHLIPAIQKLAYVLGVEGRGPDVTPLLLAAIREGQFNLHYLVLLAAAEPVIDDAVLVAKCASSTGADRLPLLGAARTAMRADDAPLARKLLLQLREAVPQSVDVQASWGLWLAENEPEAIPNWRAQLPEKADERADVWMAQGICCEKQGQVLPAIRCFAEVVERDPNHRIAHFRLGQLLTQLGESATAEPFARRAETLRELQWAADQAYKHPDSPSLRWKAATACEQLGRPWEAWAWTQLAVTPESPDDLQLQLETRRRRLAPDTPQTLASHRMNASFDKSQFPLPEFPSVQPENAIAQSTERSPVRFRDAATEMGLDFVYFNGASPDQEGTRMLETTGGGVGVIDFDQDGWPDLFFPQGGEFPVAEHSTSTDALFRNLDGVRAQNVSNLAGIRDAGYSQGVAVGDFDNDGFPDLYVAHLGRNQLYQNQGDGTFRDVTFAAGLESSQWTTSCLIADLNGDGLPDLYDVNYLSGEAVHSRICPKGKQLLSCGVASYAAAQDEVFINLGDGRFQSVTDSCGVLQKDGRGLGIVAADLDGSGRLSLFVANDAEPNFCFINQTGPDGVLKFEEQSLSRGLAYDRDGMPQACMGVAAGDANGDGRLDLFVTNFHDESNTLYLQQPGHFFIDATRDAGLRTPSYPMVGFGTQFIDAELDGDPDLVVTNGHVFDLRDQGRLFEMPAQFFRNRGNARFAELPAAGLGEYFSRRHLGRGLATLDWNRDGRPDFVVSNMNSPAALVLNETERTGNRLVIRLVNDRGARDALGATVIVRSGARQWQAQLTGGDGYESSNERVLIIGIGSADSVDSVQVTFLGESLTEVGQVDANCDIRINRKHVHMMKFFP